MATGARIRIVSEEDLDDLLPLMRSYCDFYGVGPSDRKLLELSRALLAAPDREGLQLLARDSSRAAIGFATVFWSWSTLIAARIGVMNDLYVAPEARGSGVGQELIEACRKHCRAHGARILSWQTALDNHRAQALYDRTGARREEWLDYSLPV